MRRIPLFLIVFAAACAPAVVRRAQAPAERKPPPAVELLAVADWPELADDLSPESLDTAAAESLAYLRAQGNALLSFGAMTLGAQRLIDTIEELGRVRRTASDDAELNRLLREGFELYRINRSTDPESAHFSAYYQPTLEASRERTERFRYPLYRKPPDMVTMDLGAFKKDLKGETFVGRFDGAGRLVPYFDRADVDVRGALDGKGLELAWLESGFDRLNLHIQGSGILRFPDGEEALAGFAATNARPYKSVGLALVGAGGLTREEINAQTLRQYLAEHPEGEAWLIAQNPRYTFFDLRPLPPGGEPNGTISRPLTAGRSIAIDPKHVPLGAVAFLSFRLIQAGEGGGWLGKHPTRRFVHCQDTGGAILGPGRVDLYVGHGAGAQATAHSVWEKGSLFVLLKKLPGRTR